MNTCGSQKSERTPEARMFYYNALLLASKAKVPFLVGGAYALKSYTGITRETKDLDLFVCPQNVESMLKVFSDAGYQTEITAIHWLAKAFFGDYFVDFIFNSGNGFSMVDDEWFKYASDEEILGIPVKICPAEEIITQKAFIMERERYDGADIAHLLRARAESLDWERLLRRFGPHWQVLLSHLILFGFIYPSERNRIPAWVMRELLDRQEVELTSPLPAERICQGPLISRTQYAIDVECWGYRDIIELIRTL
ncbi:MAG: nucleotidyltransferase [Nitrospirota bacterium]